jgi:hypothetical protein
MAGRTQFIYASPARDESWKTVTDSLFAGSPIYPVMTRAIMDTSRH